MSTVYTQTNTLLSWLNTCCCVPATCMCAFHYISTCVYVWKCRNTMWLVYISCAWLANYPDCLVVLQLKNDWKKGKFMHSLSVCVCPCLSETVYAHTLCIGICDWIALTSCLQLKTASSLSWMAAPRIFVTQNIYLFHMTVIRTDIHHSGHVTVTTRRRGLENSLISDSVGT